MKKSTLSIISMILAIVMLLGALAACTGTEQPDGGTTENPSTGETEDNSSDGTDPDGTDPDGSDSDESESKGDGEDTEFNPPSLSEIDNGLLIENAHALANGVNVYFSDGKRTDFVLENQNMTLEYALANYKDQLVTSLKNKEGNTYVASTCDVFVKMNNGKTFYASDSTRHATANIYRFGYYMYETRFEEQLFVGDVEILETADVSLKSIDRNQVKVSENDDGSLHVDITNPSDPYIKFNNINYSADTYGFIQVTLKASATKVRSIAFYLAAGDKTSMDGSQVKYFSIFPDGEYHTYTLPLYDVNGYTGTVNALRLDFVGDRGDSYDVKDVKFVKGDDGNPPSNLELNRSFFIYSDKLHHCLQIATREQATTNIESVGLETRIDADTVAKLIVKDADGTHDSLDDVDWSTAEYVGFDIKDAGIFGYILPAGNTTDSLEVKYVDGEYIIIQSRTPENGTIEPSGKYNKDEDRIDPLVDNNANDLFMGQRIYTDNTHDFTKFLEEAYCERNPLAEDNFLISKRESSYESTFECPNCGFVSEENMLKCTECREEVTFIEHANMYFKEYDALRGIYTFWVPSESFNAPYYQYPNKYINLTFQIKGDDHDRSIYVMTASKSGCLECAVLLDEDKMMLPVPIEVGKNFSESTGERNLWNIQDATYGEALIPMLIKKDSVDKYTFLNLYQNWGQYPLKQVSWIQFYAPYYHLSTGVTETNCIVPYYACKNARSLGTLPDHRAMSAPLWAGQPQHNSGGSHTWLQYTDADGVYSASENTLDMIDSYGPIYADVYMDYISDDGNIKVSYTHMEFPQTDENRAYYEMKYEVLGDVSFKNFSEDFRFYDVGDNDSKGSYINVGYLNENNESVIVDAAKDNESFKYVLGDECPYFSFFNMPDWNRESTSAEGYTNLSFLVYNSKFTIGGEEADPNFVIINEDNRVRISLDLEEVTLKAGDSFTINAIVMPWGSQESVYDSPDFAGDQNVRDVRENTLLNPLTPTAIENCEIIESTFLPRIKSTNGKNATFNLTGGHNNVAVRVYGLNKLTVPKIEELVDGEWVEYRVSSAYKPDRFGNAHYFDGYSVHYDKDGTFSYSFIVPMDYQDTDGRTFRLSAEEDFEEWPRKLPEIDQDTEELPMNVFVDANDIFNNAKNETSKNLNGITMSADGSYVTLSSNESAAEAYFHLWYGNGGKTVTGQYLVMKYRLPTTNNRKYNYAEFFTTTTEGASATGNCFSISNAFVNDGEWHTLAIDLSTWGQDNFKADYNGEFRVQFVRFDVFNGNYPNGNSIDIEYFGISDSLEEILAYHSNSSVTVLTEKTTLKTYDKSGNEIETPSDNSASTNVEGFNLYFPTSAITSAALGDEGHSGKTVSSEDGSYVTLHYDTVRKRVESYFTLFASNQKVTGQYLVLKYRTAKQAGYIEIYTSTEANGATAAAQIGGRTSLNGDTNCLFIADNQWHTVVIDLSKATKEGSFVANADGEYIAKFLRIDLFNFGSATTEAFSVDLAFAGLCDSYEDAISHDENTWFFDGESSINVSTGAPLTPPKQDENPDIDDAVSSVPGYNVYFDPATIKSSATAAGTGHKGNTVLAEDESYVTIYNLIDPNYTGSTDHKKESYFTLYKPSTAKATGQYLVIKYRTNVQQGTITFWSSTQKSSASSGNSTDVPTPFFIADDQWHIVVLDLSKLIGTYSAIGNKYAALHLRIDLFNFDKLRDPADTQAKVDLAYIGLCDDFSEIVCSDKSVDEVMFYDGQCSKYSTANGELTEGNAPEDGEDTEDTEGTTPPAGDDTSPKYTFYYNATSIIKASQTGGGHIGKEELLESGSVARIYNCVDESASIASRMESYFTLLSSNTAVTGKYVVIKYRSSIQVGSIQIYTSTENKGASDSGMKTLYAPNNNGLFIADGQWHIVIIDLAAATNTFSADDEGKYRATHLRIDLFNFENARNESDVAYVDLAYIGLCEDYERILGNDASVESIIFFDTETKSVPNVAK